MNELIIKLAGMIVSVISPQLREELVRFIANFEAHAKKTDNDWDDVIVIVLKAILNIK